MLRRLATLLAIAPMIATMLAMVVTTPAQAGGRVEMRLLRAVQSLDVARETRRGYDRDKFRHWVDANSDCQDTRDEVLKAESTRRTRGGCDITRGRWVSMYDGKVVRAATNLDIDHMVALAEAWDSGARRWTSETRKRFANDLGDPRALIAVTASTNRSKSDRDPADWMPARARCTYVRHWVAVKVRWRMKVDRAEKRALRNRAENCKNVKVRVRRAAVGIRDSGGGGTSTGGSSGGGTVRITGVQYDSPGSDTYSNASLNAEWVRLKNVGSKSRSVSGWKLRDATGHVYRFGTLTIRPGRTVRVHTGEGSNSRTDRYWRQGSYVWNNSGDRAVLRTKAGSRVDACAWGDGSGYTSC